MLDFNGYLRQQEEEEEEEEEEEHVRNVKICAKGSNVAYHGLNH